MRLAGAGLALMLVLSGCAEDRPMDAFPRRPSLGGSATPDAERGDGCNVDTSVTVQGQANIFGAGIADLPAPAGGGGGAAPGCLLLADDVEEIRLVRVLGSVGFVGPWFNRGGVAHKCAAGAEVANATSGPDGVWTATTCGWEPDGGTIEAAGVVSGIKSFDRVGYLVAVFLPDPPVEGPAPDGLDFSGNYDFGRLRPALAQVFFVGDGRTSLGSTQWFRVPEGAARLYLGIADAFAFHGPPGFYDDNTGAFQVRVESR